MQPSVITNTRRQHNDEHTPLSGDTLCAHTMSVTVAHFIGLANCFMSTTLACSPRLYFQALRASGEERSGRANAHRAGRSREKGGQHQHEREKQQKSQLLHYQGTSWRHEALRVGRPSSIATDPQKQMFPATPCIDIATAVQPSTMCTP